MNINHLINMDGYGAYIWSSYFITFFVFGINLVSSFREKYRIKKIIKQYLADEL